MLCESTSYLVCRDLRENPTVVCDFEIYEKFHLQNSYKGYSEADNRTKKEILWEMSNFFCEFMDSQTCLYWKKHPESSQREKTVPSNTLIIGGQAIITELGNDPEKFISAPPNTSILTYTSRRWQREKRKENIKGSTYQSCRVCLGQIRERALWSSSAVSHTQCKLGVSVQHATVCFLQKRTPNRSSSFPFVHLCLNSKGLVKLVSKDVS